MWKSHPMVQKLANRQSHGSDTNFYTQSTSSFTTWKVLRWINFRCHSDTVKVYTRENVFLQTCKYRVVLVSLYPWICSSKENHKNKYAQMHSYWIFISPILNIWLTSSLLPLAHHHCIIIVMVKTMVKTVFHQLGYR